MAGNVSNGVGKRRNSDSMVVLAAMNTNQKASVSCPVTRRSSEVVCQFDPPKDGFDSSRRSSSSSTAFSVSTMFLTNSNESSISSRSSRVPSISSSDSSAVPSEKSDSSRVSQSVSKSSSSSSTSRVGSDSSRVSVLTLNSSPVSDLSSATIGLLKDGSESVSSRFSNSPSLPSKTSSTRSSAISSTLKAIDEVHDIVQESSSTDTTTLVNYIQTPTLGAEKIEIKLYPVPGIVWFPVAKVTQSPIQER
ncbi:hypothetical protein R1sor_014691 [Riccia sorocarpa]|uniref:Uncharacterized protein n=1 Tax=Riccia sorocarpa TaxID=122646 RepID=A0ABD3HA46_9MARC